MARGKRDSHHTRAVVAIVCLGKVEEEQLRARNAMGNPLRMCMREYTEGFCARVRVRVRVCVFYQPQSEGEGVEFEVVVEIAQHDGLLLRIAKTACYAR
jgi:hypothetical protein